MARIETDPNYTSPTFPRGTAAADIFKKEDVQSVAAAFSTHVHDGAGKGLQVTAIPSSAIPDGAITSAKIADGTIATSDLADGLITTSKLAFNAATQAVSAVGVASNPATTSTTLTDCPDMAVALTTVGGDVLVWFLITVQIPTALAIATIALNPDAAGDLNAQASQAPGASGLVMLSTMLRMATPAPGLHTIRGRWAISAGNLGAWNAQRSMLAVELRR